MIQASITSTPPTQIKKAKKCTQKMHQKEDLDGGFLPGRLPNTEHSDDIESLIGGESLEQLPAEICINRKLPDGRYTIKLLNPQTGEVEYTVFMWNEENRVWDPVEKFASLEEVMTKYPK